MSRRLGPSEVRHVYRWDLDKTYLDTQFESLSRLVRIAFERPEDKRNVPGAAALLRELGRERSGQPPVRVAIVSGSPTQLRSVLEQKLRLDGVRWDEFHLKPQWDNLKRGRLRAVRDQVGYKLPLLLRSRAGLTPGVPETLFGDDAEADAFIYSLYAEIVAGRVPRDALVVALKAAGVYAEDLERCLAAADRIDPSDDVDRIFIVLDSKTPPRTFAPFGRRVVPVWNHFQAALVLFAGGHLDVDGVVAVTSAFLEADGRRAPELANLFQDVARRGFLPATAMQRLGDGIQEALAGSHLEREAEVVWLCAQRFADLGPHARYDAPGPPPSPDWRALLGALKR